MELVAEIKELEEDFEEVRSELGRLDKSRSVLIQANTDLKKKIKVLEKRVRDLEAEIDGWLSRESVMWGNS